MKKSRVMLLAVIAMVLIIGVATVVFVSCNKKNDSTTTTTNDGPVHEHISSDWIVDKEATYDEEGKKHRECVECGSVIEETSIPVLKTASEGLEFAFNEDGESYYVKGIGTCTDMNIIIPSTYNDLPVTEIGYGAFSYCDIVNITISDSVTNIGDGAFSSCYSLTSVTIPDSVTSIGHSAFADCWSLHNVIIPPSVTSIGNYAFEGCWSLGNISLPASVMRIGDNAFMDCTSLTSIEVDENNKYYKSINGNLYTKDGTTLIQYATAKKDTSFTIPDSVTIIDSHAFYNSSSLVSVVIPASVKRIGLQAFYSCDSLTSIIFENTECWLYSSNSYSTAGRNIISTDLADPSIASTYLTSTYAFYYWNRTK